MKAYDPLVCADAHQLHRHGLLRSFVAEGIMHRLELGLVHLRARQMLVVVVTLYTGAGAVGC